MVYFIGWVRGLSILRQVALYFVLPIIYFAGLFASPTAFAAPPTPPFAQCPSLGKNTSCAVLIVFNSDGSPTVVKDPSQGPYDGIEDTLIGVKITLINPFFLFR